jgi:hypothetical protein
VPKYAKPEIGCDDGGDARHVSLSVNDIVEHLRHLGAVALEIVS